MLKPYQIALWNGRLIECISNPTPDRQIMVRMHPHDPTTMVAAPIDEVRPVKVRCPRDQYTWNNPIVKPYPSEDRRSTHECEQGDLFIDCPRCGRGYFVQDDGTWRCEPDRILALIPEE